MHCVYTNSSSLGAAMRIALCIMLPPKWSERTPSCSLITTSTSLSVFFLVNRTMRQSNGKVNKEIGYMGYIGFGGACKLINLFCWLYTFQMRALLLFVHYLKY